jgi:hypothetical protein
MLKNYLLNKKCNTSNVTPPPPWKTVFVNGLVKRRFWASLTGTSFENRLEIDSRLSVGILSNLFEIFRQNWLKTIRRFSPSAAYVLFSLARVFGSRLLGLGFRRLLP